MTKAPAARATYFAALLADAGVYWSCSEEYGTCQHPECYKHTPESLASSAGVLERKVPVNEQTLLAVRAEQGALSAHKAAQAERTQQLNAVAAPYVRAIDEAEAAFHDQWRPPVALPPRARARTGLSR